jgi:hypothetical protein
MITMTVVPDPLHVFGRDVRRRREHQRAGILGQALIGQLRALLPHVFPVGLLLQLGLLGVRGF